MAIHKGVSDGTTADSARSEWRRVLRVAALALPLACLAAYALRLPLPVPRIFMPRTTYEAGGSSVESILKDAASRPGWVIIKTTAAPTLSDIRAARRHYADTGMPVLFRTAKATLPPGPLAAYSLDMAGDGAAWVLTLLVSETADGPLRVTVDGAEVMSVASVPADRRLRLPLGAPDAADAPAAADTPAAVAAPDMPAETAGRGRLAVTLESGTTGNAGRSDIVVAAPDTGEPRILMASRRLDARSFIEALRPVRKVSYGELETAGLYGYELLVLDGPVLAELDGHAASAIVEYVQRGAGSVLLVVDSPDFGKPGDAPALERLLPVELSPRSLSRLPDVAMAVAIDVSGSMYGDKLSLAKAVGLELFGNLKPSDAAGVVLFDDEARWLFPLAPVAELDAKRSLAPLRAGGGTRLYPAIAECLDALEASSLPEKRIVVVSDGISAPADFDGLAGRAFASGISISAMAVGAEYDKALLTRLAAGSGGRFYRVRDAAEVPSLIIEDRRSIARTVFSEETVDVVDIAGIAAGSIDGMARLGPKPDSVAFFSSAAGDPLLSSMRTGARSVLVYASDAYGRYGAGFLRQPATLSVLDAVIGGLFSERPPSATLTETADGLALSIRGDYLVQPFAVLADGRGRIVAEAAFDRTSPGRFHAALGKPVADAYTALVEDRGRTVARFAVFSNGGTAASPSDSAAAFMAYRAPFWALPRGGAPWLVAFFTLSLVATLIMRIRR